MGTERDAVLEQVADRLLARPLDHPLRVAVDGITASGKSTFADELASRVEAKGRPVLRVTMDGYHHRRERRHRQGRLSADGYYEDAYDLDAAARELLVPLGPGGSRRYRDRIIDLATDTPVAAEPLVAPLDAVLIVDGSFLMRQELHDHWDEVIFLDTDFDVACARGVAREKEAFGGAAAAEEAFVQRYHAAGRRYLAECDPRRHATVVIGHDDPLRPVLRRRGAPAGDFDYERHGAGYALRRQPDPRIAAVIHRAFGDARTVLNVGAGAGSYEPSDRYVLAVEPAAAMRAQRPPDAAPAVDAAAEHLPFDDDAFDAVMATVTIHGWRDVDAGLRELRRVARGPVVVLTFDGAALGRLWLAEYVPQVIEIEQRRFPDLDRVARSLGGHVEITPVPVPLDCTDGFGEAYYGRPEAFLEEDVRAAQSGWVLADPEHIAEGMRRLAADLASGAWDERHGHLRTQAEHLGAVRLVVSTP